ncbi:MAG: response regulator transcription factor [Archangiaceae bacterium]|nr:response regulator transcription factor [Archangiaceae bacterium]
MERLRVFVVEDDPLLRRHLVELLAGEPSMTVVGQAEAGDQAVAVLAEVETDVVLMDLGLPGLSGIEAIGELSKRPRPPLMMAHTVFDDRDTVLKAIKAGASSYVLKGSAPRELIEALQELKAGGAPMSPRIARAVLRELQQAPAQPDPLSPRERQLLKLVDEGLTYKQIAERLSVSPHTVHSHIKNIYDALHARSRAEALATARSRGLI